MHSTMQDFPLTVTAILRYAVAVHGDRVVTTATGDGYRHATYREVGEQAARLANALRRLGIDGDERVATFMWNNQEHLEAYLAMPSMGAVLHTLNIRLFPEQIAFVANEAEDQVVIADLSLAPLLAPVLPKMETVHTVIAVGDGRPGPLERSGKTVVRYDDLLAAESDRVRLARARRELGRRDVLHQRHHRKSERCGLQPPVELSALDGGCSAQRHWAERQRQGLPIVPMFHANAWGLPYAALMAGADLVMPDRFLDAKSLVDMIETQRPTVAGAVPTIWNDVLHCLDADPGLTSRRCGWCAAAGRRCRCR